MGGTYPGHSRDAVGVEFGAVRECCVCVWLRGRHVSAAQQRRRGCCVSGRSGMLCVATQEALTQRRVRCCVSGGAGVLVLVSNFLYTYINIHIHIYIYTYIYTYDYPHICTHTHTRTHSLPLQVDAALTAYDGNLHSRSPHPLCAHLNART